LLRHVYFIICIRKDIQTFRYDDQLRLALFLHLLHEKYKYLLHFNIITSHSALSGTTVLAARPKLLDQSCHKTEVSDPKSSSEHLYSWCCVWLVCMIIF